MADFSSVGAFDSGIFNLSIFASLPVASLTPEQLSWSDGVQFITLTGTGFVTRVVDGHVVAVTAGVITGIDIHVGPATGGTEVHVTGLALAAPNIYREMLAGDWTAFADDVTKGEDTFFGTTGDDILLAGRGIDILYGYRGDDVLDGGINDDILNGGQGNDTLTGGISPDQFIFVEAPTAANADVITDFEHDKDHIQIFGRKFAGVGPSGDLQDTAFHIGPEATTRKQHIIYDPVTGDLMYDRDGSGARAAVVFYHLEPDLPLTATDITIF